MEFKKLGKTDVDIPTIGMGTMGFGGYFSKDVTKDDFYIEVIKNGIELGLTFIDTAEAYGEGHSESLIGKAITDCREKVFISTKVSPEHLSYDEVLKAAEGSLRRLKTDYIDLYQVHWPNPAIPIQETLRAMEYLVKEKKIRYIGVSNFSLKELREVNDIFKGDGIVSNQIEYNLFDRTIEGDILPYCEENKITVIAYSPIDQGRFRNDSEQYKVLHEIAERHSKKPSQVILNWLISHKQVIAIPKASNINHIKDNASSADFDLTEADIRRIDETFVQQCINIQTDRIRVDKNGLYKFVPSPEVLAKSIREGIPLKPIRVIPTKDTSGKYDYDLVEGKVRYWAWVIAHNGNAPIKALVR